MTRARFIPRVADRLAIKNFALVRNQQVAGCAHSVAGSCEPSDSTDTRRADEAKITAMIGLEQLIFVWINGLRDYGKNRWMKRFYRYCDLYYKNDKISPSFKRIVTCPPHDVPAFVDRSYSERATGGLPLPHKD
jgi:hypothetical protein